MKIGEAKLARLTFVDNCAYGHILAASKLKSAKKAPAGNAYNINDGKDFVYTEWVKAIGMGVGAKETDFGQYQVPAFFGLQIAYWTEVLYKYFGWCIDPKKKGPVVNMVAILNLLCHHTSSIEKAKRDLGYEPVVDADSALNICIKWCQDNLEELSK